MFSSVTDGLSFRDEKLPAKPAKWEENAGTYAIPQSWDVKKDRPFYKFSNILFSLLQDTHYLFNGILRFLRVQSR